MGGQSWTFLPYCYPMLFTHSAFATDFELNSICERHILNAIWQINSCGLILIPPQPHFGCGASSVSTGRCCNFSSQTGCQLHTESGIVFNSVTSFLTTSKSWAWDAVAGWKSFERHMQLFGFQNFSFGPKLLEEFLTTWDLNVFPVTKWFKFDIWHVSSHKSPRVVTHFPKPS